METKSIYQAAQSYLPAIVRGNPKITRVALAIFAVVSAIVTGLYVYNKKFKPPANYEHLDSAVKKGKADQVKNIINCSPDLLSQENIKKILYNYANSDLKNQSAVIALVTHDKIRKELIDQEDNILDYVVTRVPHGIESCPIDEQIDTYTYPILKAMVDDYTNRIGGETVKKALRKDEKEVNKWPIATAANYWRLNTAKLLIDLGAGDSQMFYNGLGSSRLSLVVKNRCLKLQQETMIEILTAYPIDQVKWYCKVDSDDQINCKLQEGTNIDLGESFRKIVSVIAKSNKKEIKELLVKAYHAVMKSDDDMQKAVFQKHKKSILGSD